MIGAPLTRTMTERLGIDIPSAKLIRRLCRLADEPEKLAGLIDANPRLERTAAYARTLRSSPYNSRLWRRTMVLHACDVLVEGHGVEGSVVDCHNMWLGPAIEFVNMGDSYAPTLVYLRREDRVRVGAWAEYV